MQNFLCFSALCVCLIRSRTDSSIEVTEQSEVDLHREGVCLVAINVFVFFVFLT